MIGLIQFVEGYWICDDVCDGYCWLLLVDEDFFVVCEG